MSGKDRGKRGKNIEEVTYFVPIHAPSYACYGQLGHSYAFTKTDPAKVHLACDIEAFRMKKGLAESDAKGNLLNKEIDGPKPLSMFKTVPATPSPIKSETEVLTTDKKKKKKSKPKKKKVVKKKEKKEEEDEEEEEINEEKINEDEDDDEDEEEQEGILGLDTDVDEEDEED